MKTSSIDAKQLERNILSDFYGAICEASLAEDLVSYVDQAEHALDVADSKLTKLKLKSSPTKHPAELAEACGNDDCDNEVYRAGLCIDCFQDAATGCQTCGDQSLTSTEEGIGLSRPECGR